LMSCQKKPVFFVENPHIILLIIFTVYIIIIHISISWLGNSH
jgi:hypothetical protein